MIYCDYNSTSPVADQVLDLVSQGTFFANSSSPHQYGRKSAQQVLKVKDFLREYFSSRDAHIIFHSGTTEALNSFCIELLLSSSIDQSPLCYVYSELDHACSVEQAQRFTNHGHQVLTLIHNSSGDLDLDASISHIKKNVPQGSKIFLNYSWVHNETGVIWPLGWAQKIKEETGAIIHVDATQAIGKVFNAGHSGEGLALNTSLDMYSFSGHKFGALKGVGFTLLQSPLNWQGIMLGGSQQSLRSSTLNTVGIMSLQVALESLVVDYKLLDTWIKDMRQKLTSVLMNEAKGAVLATSAKYKNINTLSFYLHNYQAQMLIPIFEQHGLIVGSGSACSSGSLQGSHVMHALGLGEWAKHLIRISVSPSSDANTLSAVEMKFFQVLGSL